MILLLKPLGFLNHWCQNQWFQQLLKPKQMFSTKHLLHHLLFKRQQLFKSNSGYNRHLLLKAVVSFLLKQLLQSS